MKEAIDVRFFSVVTFVDVIVIADIFFESVQPFSFRLHVTIWLSSKQYVWCLFFFFEITLILTVS
jgi:hypothetical protein